MGVINLWELFHGPNAGYVLDLYDRYQQDPNAVDPATRAVFAQLPPDILSFTTTAAPVSSSAASMPTAPGRASAAGAARIVAAARLARSIREYGHLDAQIDPLGAS